MKAAVLILLVSLNFCLQSIAQQKQQEVQIQDINARMQQHLNPEQYIDSVNKILYILLGEGKFYPKDTLIHYLQTYKDYVWSDSKFVSEKPNYYINLGNNASSQNKLGEAIFFYEKADRELEIQKGRKPGFVLMKQIYLYTQNKNYKRAVEAYEKERSWIEAAPSSIRTGNLKGKDILLMLYILNPVASSYVFLKDSSNTDKVIQLANNILLVSDKDKDLGKNDMAIIRFLYEGMRYYKYRYLQQQKNEIVHPLNSIRSILQDSALMEPVKLSIENNLTEWLTDYYIFTGNADSASFYLKKLAGMPMVMTNSNEYMLLLKRFEFKILGLKSGHGKITDLAEEMISLMDTINLSQSNQMNDMLYAYTKAEFSDSELKKAETEVEKRAIALIIVSLLAVIVIVAVYLKMKAKNKKIKGQIDTINLLTNLKIATLEESKQQAIKEEQERLSQELHDNFSSVLAGLKYQIDDLYAHSEDVQKNSIQQIQQGFDYLYASARNKSHQWFYDSRLLEQTSFTDTIHFLVNSALPDAKYKKNLQIEAATVLLFEFEDKINILRIIQESLTNIIKHSKADEVSIFLHSTDRQIILQISDNGIGFNTRKGKQPTRGMGLDSIEKRVALLKGRFEIINDEGTTLNITLVQTH